MKIKVRLDILAQKLGKTITDIAEETGLNRNTVTALYHNNVDGIKFDTIEKICSTYNVPISEIIEISTSQPKETTKPTEVSIENPYKQEGDIILFTAFPTFQMNTQPKEFFDVNLGNLTMFFKKDYGMVYWEKDKMNRAARSVYERYQHEKKLNVLFDEFDIYAKDIEKLYKNTTKDEVLSYSNNDLVGFLEKINAIYVNFWKLGLFIDTFDPGFDVEKTSDIQKKFKFTDAEVASLTTPEQMIFGNERLLRLLEIVKKIDRKGISHTEHIKKFIKTLPEYQDYVRDFDYYKSNYAHVGHITEDDTVDEIERFLKDQHWKEEYKKLSSYSKTVRKNNLAILKKHHLKNNPLYFFQKLIYWREYRKQVNLMGIHLLHYVLFSIEQKTGVPYKYLKHLTFDEVPNILKGLISRDELEKRYEEGIIFSVIGEGTKIIEGKEALSIRDELEKRIRGSENEKIIPGRVACQGYAKGTARIILGQEDFKKFNDGEILITGMTRPEFVPLMKKAAAIVTNEGGITCHAAIVSRELGKPCIIGTQKATQLIKDGDLIEVRANHGTVRILS